MRRSVMRVLLAITIVVAAFVLGGCETAENRSEDAAEKRFESAGFDGVVRDSDAQKITASDADEEPSNHEMMAMFMLSQAGYDSNLSTYERVDLVTLTLEDGSEVKAVVVNEGDNVVFPQNVGSAQ